MENKNTVSQERPVAPANVWTWEVITPELFAEHMAHRVVASVGSYEKYVAKFPEAKAVFIDGQFYTVS